MNQNILLSIILGSAFFLSQLTQAASVKLYGQGHLSLDHLDDGDETSVHTTSSSSRFGISGERSLDNGMTLIFQYETGVDLTAQGGNDGNGPTDAEDSGQLFTKGRPSFLGVRTEWGTLLIGHTPGLDQWANDYNLFADQVGDTGNFWELAGLEGRLDNVIQYTSPTIDGFKLSITHSPNEESSPNSADKTYLKADYAQGDLKLGFGFADVAAGPNALAFTAGYEFGDFTLGGGLQIVSDVAGIDGNDFDSFSIGGSLNLSSISKVKAHIASIDGENANSGATLLALGYDYKLDKTTTVYIAYSVVTNESAAAFLVNGKGHGDAVVPAAGEDPSVLSIGIVASFDVLLMR